MHPAGYETYWQYTTALAGSLLAAMNTVISSADNANGILIWASPVSPIDEPEPSWSCFALIRFSVRKPEDHIDSLNNFPETCSLTDRRLASEDR
jgi:hypothetical protein